MRIVVKRERIELILSMRQRAQLLANGKWKLEAARGVADAGRLTKTQVQRAVHRQMALKGNYSSVVVAGTRGTPRMAELAYDIYGVTGGQRIELYKSLRVLKIGGAASTRGNAGRGQNDQGSVRSDVWNNSRIFKRSFGANGGYFATLPAGQVGSRVAPRMVWTYGSKPGQPREANGRFVTRGIKYGKICRLFGPTLNKEIPQGVPRHRAQGSPRVMSVRRRVYRRSHLSPPYQAGRRRPA